MEAYSFTKIIRPLRVTKIGEKQAPCGACEVRFRRLDEWVHFQNCVCVCVCVCASKKSKETTSIERQNKVQNSFARKSF